MGKVVTHGQIARKGNVAMHFGHVRSARVG